MNISACVVTYNEENNIRRCLESLKWVDEIIVVDSFSTDRTIKIVREFTERIFCREWKGQIDQKGFALNCTKGEWVLLLDADECLSPALTEEIKATLGASMTQDCDGFYFPRCVHYLGKWIRHGEWYPDYKLRLFRRSKGEIGGVEPHDKVIIKGKAGYLKNDLQHFTYENIAHQISTMNDFSGISAGAMKERGRRFHLYQILLRPLVRFISGYVLRWGFIDGIAGLIIAFISSFGVFSKYAKLWELDEVKKDNKCSQFPVHG